MKIATGFYIEGSNNRHLNLKVSKMELLHQYKFWGPNFRGNFCEFLNHLELFLLLCLRLYQQDYWTNSRNSNVQNA